MNGRWVAHLRALGVDSRLKPSTLVRLGLPHLVVASLSVQGLAYVSQLVLASLVPPAEFGIVRAVEACLGLLLLVSSLGMPTLTVRMIADTDDRAVRGRLLGHCIFVAAASSTAGAAAVGVVALSRADAMGAYLSALVWVTGLTATSRVCIAYYQGVRQVKQVSVLLATMAALSLPVLIVPTALLGLPGWVLGRYLSEILLLGALLLSLWPAVRFVGTLPEEYALGRLARTGLVVAISLSLRSAVDSAGLLALGATWPASVGLGHFGLGALLVPALLLVPAGVGTILLPRMVEARHRSSESLRLLASQIVLALLLTLPASALMAALTPTLIRTFLPTYRGGEAVVRALLFIAPCRALTGAAGNLLLAHGHFGFALFANATALVLLGSLSLAVARAGGPLGVAWISLGVEALTAAVLVSAAWRAARRACPSENPNGGMVLA